MYDYLKTDRDKQTHMENHGATVFFIRADEFSRKVMKWLHKRKSGLTAVQDGSLCPRRRVYGAARQSPYVQVQEATQVNLGGVRRLRSTSNSCRCHRFDQSAVNIILSTLLGYEHMAYGYNPALAKIQRTAGGDFSVKHCQ